MNDYFLPMCHGGVVTSDSSSDSHDEDLTDRYDSRTPVLASPSA
jgi:hypothetical protein